MQLPNSASEKNLWPLLQELASFPITLDNEGSDASSDFEADGATLPDQPAALTELKVRQQVPSNVDFCTHVTFLKVKGRTPFLSLSVSTDAT